MTGKSAIANLTGGVTLSPTSTQVFGKHSNNPKDKLFSVMISEMPKDAGLTSDSNLQITTKRCTGDCFT